MLKKQYENYKKQEKIGKLLHINSWQSTMFPKQSNTLIPNADITGIVALKNLVHYDPLSISNWIQGLMINFLASKFFMVPSQLLVHEYVTTTSEYRCLKIGGSAENTSRSTLETFSLVETILGRAPSSTVGWLRQLPSNENRLNENNNDAKRNTKTKEIRISEELLNIIDVQNALERNHVESTRSAHHEEDHNQPCTSSAGGYSLPTLHQIEINFMNHLNTMTTYAKSEGDHFYLSPLLSELNVYNRYYLSMNNSPIEIDTDAVIVKNFLEKRRKYHEEEGVYSVRSELRASFFQMWINLIDVELNATAISEALIMESKFMFLSASEYDRLETDFLQNLLGL
ncbi:hypothetical protein CAEBREN_00207 [Caenorhabditis brenneri]|uniref:Uncharacterized protein n=1 Tax=Caenorhabditis brenneri TaxID=135651 RepID=G0MX84_CAEBE|nr:hypothetical protein CAEBREN_00207 [Caenorhabditis brenneri]